MVRCNAKKTNGEPCQAWAMEGKTKCRVHGGKTPAGIASPHYKTGRYSKYLPTRLSSQYESAKNDPALLELREDIALIDARLSDLLQRVETGESGQVWKELGDAYRDLQDAMHAKNTVKTGEALQLIYALIVRGNDDYRAWTEIHEVIEQRRRLVESERKRIVETKQTLTVEQAMLMIGALTNIIRTHVTDRQILSAISGDINKLVMVEDIG